MFMCILLTYAWHQCIFTTVTSSPLFCSYENRLQTRFTVNSSCNIVCECCICIYTIILHKSVCLSVCLSVGVRKLQVAILARFSREMSLTVRIVWEYILSRVRVCSAQKKNYPRKTSINYHESHLRAFGRWMDQRRRYQCGQRRSRLNGQRSVAV